MFEVKKVLKDIILRDAKDVSKGYTKVGVDNRETKIPPAEVVSTLLDEVRSYEIPT